MSGEEIPDYMKQPIRLDTDDQEKISSGDPVYVGLSDGVKYVMTPEGRVNLSGELVEEDFQSVTSGPDPVNHPLHYNMHPSGIECIDVIEHMPYNVGAAVKYVWRAGLKGSAIEDLKKAAWHLNREIERLEKKGGMK